MDVNEIDKQLSDNLGQINKHLKALNSGTNTNSSMIRATLLQARATTLAALAELQLPRGGLF